MGTTVKLPIYSVVALGSLLLSGCAEPSSSSAGAPTAAMQSMHTQLDPGSCKREIDKSDPNETPYFACPGVAGYTLNVRRVESGRRSIEIVDPSRRAFPLDYQEFVTRHMFTLGDKAEWRVAMQDGKQVPVALIVRVRAHEDENDPERETGTYLAVAKITPDQACVIAAIREGTRPEAEVQTAADKARDSACMPSLPPLGSAR